MPLDPERVLELNAKLDSLRTRFDKLLQLKAINDAYDDEDEEEEELLDPALEALNSSTLEAPPNKVPDPPEVDEPWWD
jgi:hypothetical protein